MTRVLLVGSGAREHAIAQALSKSEGVELYAAMSSMNPGIMRLARENVVLKITDPNAVAEYAKRTKSELAVVGPEAPLVNGVVDELGKFGVECVGPSRRLAAIEGDKAFCRELLEKYGIPGNPPFQVFYDYPSAERFLLQTTRPIAIKPAGLTGGKGVKVSGDQLPDKDAELAYAKEVLGKNVGGLGKLVVEEKMEGEEYSLQAFVDGRSVHVMPLVQDHKRAFEGDSGPNTGGMGSYSDANHVLPFMSESDVEVSCRIMGEVVNALKQETGEEYRGILYGGFMLARGGNEDRPTPKLIEFNCRFGDPEAMNVLPLLSEDSDFMEICYGVANGSLKPKQIQFEHKATVCKYLVPDGYPDNPAPGQRIIVDEAAVTNLGASCFYASVDVSNNHVVTTKSRTVGIVGAGTSIDEAEKVAEKATAFVQGPLRHRRDIGTPALVQKRIDHIKRLSLTPPMKAS